MKRFVIGLAVAAACVVPAAPSWTAPATGADDGVGVVAPLPAPSARAGSGGLQPAKGAVADGSGATKPKPGSKLKDPAKDAGCCSADITNVDVSAKSGVLAFKVATKNVKSLRGDDYFGTYFDTDTNPATGMAGFEYAVAIFGATLCGGTACAAVYHWSGAAWDIVPATGTWKWKSGPTFNLLVSDIGSPGSFDFFMFSQLGSSTADRAPNSGTWTFALV